MKNESQKHGTTLRALEEENQSLRTDLAMARAEIDRLERLADEDVLIPVLNRRAFMQAFVRMKAFDERYGMPLSVIYLDLNDFKSVNDAHGHAAGDAVLRHVGEVLLSLVRRSDLVGRLGGDEFGVLLANAKLEFAEVKALQLAEVLEASPAKFEGQDLPVSVAFGAIEVAGKEDIEAALARADKAMYRRKRKYKEGLKQ